MCDSVFDSFINNVYSGGSAIAMFDGYVGGLEVVGAAEDISVQSIFGGKDLSADDSSDSESTQSDSDREDDTFGGGVNSVDSSTGGNSPVVDDSPVGGDSPVVGDSPVGEISIDLNGGNAESFVSDFNISIGGDVSDDLHQKYDDIFAGGAADEPILDSINIQLDEPIVDSFDLKKSEGLTAHDVAGMLSSYR